jgi:hypothetical protein
MAMCNTSSPRHPAIIPILAALLAAGCGFDVRCTHIVKIIGIQDQSLTIVLPANREMKDLTR